MSLRTYLLPAVAIAGICAGFVLKPVVVNAETAAAVPAAATTTIEKSAIEAIIKDYIMNNPTVIMDSVDQFQKRTMREKSAGAIKTNEQYLSKDDGAPFLGNPDGDVKVIEFFDYNCGYCKKVLPELIQLTEKDKNVKIIFKDIPILGPTSETAAKWAVAAHMQKKYFPFHKNMMDHKGPINDEVLEKAAKDAGVDVEKLKKDIEGTEVLMQIEKNSALAGQLGITGTPAFVIGEDIVPGALPIEEMERLVQEARKNKTGGQ